MPHYILDLVLACCAAAVFAAIAYMARNRPRASRNLLWMLCVLGTAIVSVYVLFSTVRVSRRFDADTIAWVRCIGLFTAASAVYAGPLLLIHRRVGKVSGTRRELLRLTTAAAVATPVVLAGVAIVRRHDLQFREVEIPVPGLPRDLHGLRLGQLSDIHLSTFVPEHLLVQAIGMINDAKPDLILVTGDLISTRGDPLDACLKHLAALRATAGVFGCNGNHEIYAGAQRYVEMHGPRHGMQVLRNENVPLTFGSATLNLAGVDYQRRGAPYLRNAENLVVPGAFNVLLSHNPDVFPQAASKNFDLTLAGHTHGGQVNFEIIHPSLNVARFITPYVYGLYESNGRSIYVTRGVGTIGVPARFGAPPEVVCMRLCAT